MDQSNIPQGWKTTKASILPQNPMMLEIFEQQPRIDESMVPANVRSKIPKHVNFVIGEQPTISHNGRIFYRG